MLFPAYVPGLSIYILDYSGVTVIGFNENTLNSNKSCKAMAESREVRFPVFQMKESRNE